MSDTTDIVLEQLRTTQRELELDHVQLAGRILQISHDIALIENGPRRKPGRPRSVSALNTYPSQIVEHSASARATTPLQMPQRVAGGTGYQERGDGTLVAPIATEADLPSLDDVRGILRTDPPEAA